MDSFCPSAFHYIILFLLHLMIQSYSNSPSFSISQNQINPVRTLPQLIHIHINITINCVGRDSAGSIAFHHGLDGPGIESRWGRDFPHPSRPAMVRGDNHPPPSRAKVKERVKLYFCSPSRPSWPVSW